MTGKARLPTWRATTIAAFVLCAAPAFGQGDLGGIAGVVKDATGAVLPGVTVEASSAVRAGDVRTAVTDDQGLYKIVDLRPGFYSVTFSLTGFGTVKREGIELTAAFTASVNAELRVGSLEETVTVSGQSPIVDVQNTIQQRAITASVIDAIPSGRTFQSLGQLIPGVTRSDGQDVGGMSGDRFATLAIHGSHGGDMPLIFDGMRYNNMNGSGGGGLTNFMLNTGSIQEMSVEIAGASVENQVSGVFINVIPKEGGNTFKGFLFASGSNRYLQSDNLTDSIKAAGLTNVTTEDRIWDVNPGMGGPIVKDRLWYQASARYWGNVTNVGGMWFNATPNSPFYTPDFNRPAQDGDTWLFDANIRLTWQPSARNKVTFYYDNSQRRIARRNASPTVSTDASENYTTPGNGLMQISWSSPRTSRLLIEAGATFYPSHFTNCAGGPGCQPEVLPTTVSILEQSTGLQYAAIQGRPEFRDISLALNQKLNISYITGSHALKFGLQMIEGSHQRPSFVGGNMYYQFLNGVPRSLTEWATPYSTDDRLNPSPSIYAQDQWTEKNLTVTYGLRLDYLIAYVPPQQLPAAQLVPARNFAGVDNVPKWYDVSPRLGLSYNLFGDGRTALKVSLNRYVQSQTLALADAANPVVTSVLSATRTWNDANHNYLPDCDFSNPAANGECGAISNLNFGKNNPNATHYDSNVLNGFDKRPFDWEFMTGIQHEVRPGLAASASFFRHWFGNFYTTDNAALTSASFDAYCVTAPVDARLPGGGGNQICGFYDVKPAQFGQVSNQVTFSNQFGKQREVYTGVDLNINARFAHDGFLQGGITTGRTSTSNCFMIGAPQLLYAGTVASVNAESHTTPFCSITPPLSAGTTLKFVGTYPLPWNFSTSATFQNVPGPQITATYAVPTAAVAASLGRNPNSAVTVDLIPPGTLYAPRINQLDLRLGRTFPVGQSRIKANVELYNALNSSGIQTVNTTFGPKWQQPTSILQGRLLRVGTQIEW
jgi:hypothetical protein